MRSCWSNMLSDTRSRTEGMQDPVFILFDAAAASVPWKLINGSSTSANFMRQNAAD